VPQRVLCVSVETRVCEETRYFVRLVDGLRERKHEVLSFVPEDEGPVAEAVTGRRWWNLSGWLGERLFQGEWVRVATDFRPAVIHACGLGAVGPARILASALALPCVVSLFEVPGRRWARAVRAAAGRTHLTLVATHAELAQRLETGLFAQAGRVETILPGVPTATVEKRFEEESRLPIVGTVVEPQAAGEAELLFQAAALLREQGVRCEYVVVSGGLREHQLRQLTRRLGIRRQANFLPAMMDPGPVLAEMDVVVVLSHRRLHALGILEAQTVGTAVVAASVPGVDEFIEDGATGRVLAEPTPGALARLLRELCEDRDARRSLGERARSRALRSASLKKMLDSVEALYDTVVADAGGESP